MSDSENTLMVEDSNNSKNASTPLRAGGRGDGRQEDASLDDLDGLVRDPCGPIVTSFSSATIDQIITQILEGYVLPLLPSAALHIHNIHLKCTTINNSGKYYDGLDLPSYKQNTGKYQLLHIGNIRLSYVFYPNCTIDIYTKNSNNPFRLQTEADCTNLLSFIRKIKDNLTSLGVVVPGIEKWQFTECDINRDIKVSDLLHFAGVKIQVKHMDHLFRVYIKKIGEGTFCRVEETKHLKKSVIEAINDIFNPYERIGRQIAEIRLMLNLRSG
jgi:hypothetical protein